MTRDEIVLEKFPGGPAVRVPAVEQGPFVSTCHLCGRPATGDFCLHASHDLCRVCFWQYPFNVNADAAVALGYQIGGTGI